MAARGGKRPKPTRKKKGLWAWLTGAVQRPKARRGATKSKPRKMSRQPTQGAAKLKRDGPVKAKGKRGMSARSKVRRGAPKLESAKANPGSRGQLARAVPAQQRPKTPGARPRKGLTGSALRDGGLRSSSPVARPRKGLTALGAPQLPVHAGPVVAVTLSPDGSQGCSAGRDGTLALWDMASGAMVRRWQGHEGGVPAVVFSSDAGRLVSAGADGAVRVWETARAVALCHFAAHEGWAYRLLRLADGRVVSGGSDGRLCVFDLQAEERVATLEGHGRVVSALAASPNGRLLASGSGDQSIRLWELETMRCSRVLTGHRAELLGLAFSPDGSALASASADGVVRWWSSHEDGTVLLEAKGHAMEWLAFDRRGRTLLAAGGDGTLTWLDAPPGGRVKGLRAHRSPVLALSVDAEAALGVTAGGDRKLCLWRLTGARKSARFEARAPLTSAQLRTGRALAGDDEGRVYVLSAR